MTNNPFSGLLVALATPFTPEDTIDLASFRNLVRHVVDGGADVLVPLGTTGEAPTLSAAERDAVIAACLEEARGVPVVVGTGANATRTAAEQSRRARELGVAGVLVVTPYYNKPNPDGLVAHYEAVAEAVPGLPVVAYNVPGRTGVNLAPAVLARLWENPQVVAVKEAGGNIVQAGEILRTLPEGKGVLSGDDSLTLPMMALGACGVVSVLGNVCPRLMKDLVEHARAGRTDEARRLHHRLLPLMDALFAESNPVPVKAALARMGLGTDRVRLPLAPASAATVRRLAETMRSAGLEVGR